jgi:hypothetical protein
MTDIEHGFKWWIRYVVVPLMAGGGLFAIFGPLINRSQQTPVQNVKDTGDSRARIVKGAKYNEVESTDGRSPGQGASHKLLGQLRTETSAPQTRTEPLTPVVRGSAQQEQPANNRISNFMTANAGHHSLDSSKQAALSDPGVFDNLDYRLSVGTLRKAGDEIRLEVVAETHDQKAMPFYIHSCYLLDENGARWDLPVGGTDSGHFMQAAAQLIPGTRLKSQFRFVAKGDSTGAKFTFNCTEWSPRANRTIVLSDLGAN